MIAIFVFSIALEETPCSDLVPEVWFYLEPAEHAGILGGKRSYHVLGSASSTNWLSEGCTRAGLDSKNRFNLRNGFSRRFQDRAARAYPPAIVIGSASKGCRSKWNNCAASNGILCSK